MPTADSIQNETTAGTGPPSHRIVLVACVVVLVMFCLWVVATVVYCTALRLSYPFELSWMEGCFVDHARRVAAGKPIYAAPSAEFIGLLYTPVGHFAAAGLIRLGLDGFLATRLVSLFSLVGAGLLGVSMAARAAPHPWVCVLVPVLIMSGYLDVDAYMDVGRSDSLLAFFCLAAVGVLSLRSARLAVALFVLFAVTALFIKQSSLVFLIVLLGGVSLWHRRVALWCAALLAAGATVCFLFADHITEGMFHLYTVELPSHHRLDHAALIKSLGTDFLGSFAILTAAMLTCLVVLALRKRTSIDDLNRSDRAFIVLLIGAAAAGVYAAVSRWNVGGGGNVLVPYAILGAVFLPAAVSRLVHRLTLAGYTTLAWPAGLVLLTVAVGGGLGQFNKHIPTERDRAEWARLRGVLAEMGPPERIWVPCHGSALGAGLDDPMRPHVVTLMEYVGGTFGHETGYDPPADLVALIEQQYFHAIVGSAWYLLPLFEPYYEPDTRHRPFVLRTMSGWYPEQEAIWIPRNLSQSQARP